MCRWILWGNTPPIRQNVESPVVDVPVGGAIRQGEEVLKRAGMPNLHVLDSGLNEWTGAGKPVERGRERISLERQVRIAAGALTATGGVLALVANPLFGLLSASISHAHLRSRFLRDNSILAAPFVPEQLVPSL